MTSCSTFTSVSPNLTEVFYVVYFRTNPVVLVILFFVIIRNSFNWENKEKKDPKPSQKRETNSRDNKSSSKSESEEDEEKREYSRPNRSSFQVGNERDTLFRYTLLYPAPEQDLSRPTTSKKTKFYSTYIRVVRIHFYLLVLPVLVDLGLLLIFNLKNDAQYFEHLSLIFGKNYLYSQYLIKVILILLR